MMIKMTSRKYWHSPTLRGFCAGVITSFDMYKEAAEGDLDEEWKLDKDETASFEDFRMVMSGQMLAYTPLDRNYPGDEAHRKNTQLSMAARKRTREMALDNVTRELFEQEKTGDPNCRLCGDLTKFTNHVLSYKTVKHVHVCVVCGKDCYNYCNLCGVYAHKQTNRGKHGERICDFKWHNDSFFGLAKKDHQVHLKKSRNTYNEPTPHEEFEQRELIKSFKRARFS